MSGDVGEPCAARSQRLGEPLTATATETAGWLLVERPGRWGRDALHDSGIAPPVAEALEAAAARAGLRPLLVRRPGRGTQLQQRVVLVSSGGDGARAAAIRATTVSSDAELASLDLGAFARGDSGDRLADPLFLVCTHGRRDVCCARLGVAVARELESAYPGQVWECSHLGGHRFAANVLLLPQGVMLGRVDPSNARFLAADLLAGRLPLGHLRGRCSLAQPAQAAETLVRGSRGVLEMNGLTVTGVVRAEEGPNGVSADIELSIAGRAAIARVRGVRGEPLQASCESAKLERPLHWSLEHLLELDRSS